MKLHRAAYRSRQRGLSFIGVIIIGLLAVAAFAIGGQSIPVFLESHEIQKAITKASRSETTVPGIRSSFDRTATIDDISSVTGKDLEISKRNDKVIVRVKYNREIALAGPAYLVFRFDMQSE